MRTGCQDDIDPGCCLLGGVGSPNRETSVSGHLRAHSHILRMRARDGGTSQHLHVEEMETHFGNNLKISEHLSTLAVG